MKNFSVIVYRDYKVTERFKVRVSAEDESTAMKLAEQAVENGDDSAVLFGDIDRFDIQVEADENNIREVHNRTKLQEEHHILLMKAIMNSGDKE